MYIGKCLRKGASLLQMPLEIDLKPSVSKQSWSPPRLTQVHSHVLLPQKDAELTWWDDCDPVSLRSVEASHCTAGRIQQVRTGGKALPLYGAVTSQCWSHQEGVSCFFTQAVHIPHRLRGGGPFPRIECPACKVSEWSQNEWMPGVRVHILASNLQSDGLKAALAGGCMLSALVCL